MILYWMKTRLFLLIKKLETLLFLPRIIRLGTPPKETNNPVFPKLFILSGSGKC